MARPDRSGEPDPFRGKLVFALVVLTLWFAFNALDAAFGPYPQLSVLWGLLVVFNSVAITRHVRRHVRRAREEADGPPSP